jgi:hypothetical protein
VPGTARFVYTPGAGAGACVSGATLQRAVVARMGRDPFLDDAGRTVTVKLQRSGPEFLGRIELTDRAGKVLGVQEIQSRSADCAELAAALELTLSVLLEAPVAAAAPKAQRVEASVAATEPADQTASRGPDFEASLGALVGFAAAPTPVAGLSLGFEARWPSVSLGLEGRVDTPSRLSEGDGYLQSSLWMVTFVPCWRYRQLGICGLLAAGVQKAEAVGLPGGSGSSALYLAPGARLALSIPLSSIFAAQFRTDLLVPVAKTSLYSGFQEAWVTPPASLAVGLALEAKISR